MTIASAREKCKTFLARIPRDGLILAILILASSASFGLGFLAGQQSGAGEGSALSISTLPLTASSTPTASGIVGSKNGTKYYFPGCSGIDRISAVNKIYFSSAAEAEALGYQLAAGCSAP